MNISSSQFACRAAGIAPDPNLPVMTGDVGVCAFCGGTVEVEEPFERIKKFSAKFADYPSLASRSSDVGCWGCHQARKTENDMLQKAAKAIYTEDGVFKSHSRADQAYHLYNPPRGKFLWVISYSKNEHMVWRTPVAVDRERFPVRIGSHLVTVDRPRMFAALEIWKEAVAAVRATGRNTVQLCESVDAEMMDGAHLKLKKRIVDLGLPEVARLQKALVQMSVGETWALSVLILYHNTAGWDALPGQPGRMF